MSKYIRKTTKGNWIRVALTPKQKEYIDALIQFKDRKSYDGFHDDEKYNLFRVMGCKSSIVAINRYIKERRLNDNFSAGTGNK